MDLTAKARELAGSHLVVDDDCWYSCPASGECCNENETACNCGLEARVVAIESALRAAQAAALREAADGINNDTRAYGDYWREEVADWLRDRASRLAQGKL